MLSDRIVRYFPCPSLAMFLTNVIKEQEQYAVGMEPLVATSPQMVYRVAATPDLIVACNPMANNSVVRLDIVAAVRPRLRCAATSISTDSVFSNAQMSLKS
jgi:hypothetical protein